MRRGPALTARPALAAIRGYQRWISPHKGFCCALRATTGAESCSAYGHRVIARFGLRRGLGLLQRRLELCGHVHGRPAAPAPRHPRRRREQGFCDASCDLPGCDLPDLPCHGGAGHGIDDAVCDVLDCASNLWDCGRSRRQQGENCRSCRGPSRRQRSTPQLDALANRIRDREQRRSQTRRTDEPTSGAISGN